MEESFQYLTHAAEILAGAYVTVMIGGALVQNLASERIKSQEQLERVAKEEAETLGVNTDNLFPKFYSRADANYKNRPGARAGIKGFDLEADKVVQYSEVDGDGTIPIQILEVKEGFGATRKTVKHELYHLKDHMPQRGRLRYWFHDEPAAIIYATTGIKL